MIPHSFYRGERENLNTADSINAAWVLQGGKQFKTAILVLAAINLAAAVTMIANILYDAWMVRKWDFESKKQKYFGWLLRIHPAEMFPLILSAAVVLQSIVVLPIQGINTDPILFHGCRKTVQLIWPAIWIAPITMLVFGLETTFRSLRRNRFPSRNRWHIQITLAAIVALTIFLWAASNVFPTRGACVTGLIWWTARYFKLAIAVCSGLFFLYLTTMTIIAVQLVKTVKIDRAERIAATRVVYYLVVDTWIILLVLPYYIQIAMNTRAQMTAQIAEVALNLVGIINLIMHVFLRSNADRLAIRGADTPWSDKRTMRVFGPSDLNVRERIRYPVLWQAGDHDNDSFIGKKLEKGISNSTVHSDCDDYSTCGPLQHAVFPSPTGRPLTPPLKMSPVRQATRNNSAYTIFPAQASVQQAHMSTSTTFSNVNEGYEMPLPPPPLFALKHDRSESDQSRQSRQSSATVQIGLRLSYMNHALDPIEASPPSDMQLPHKTTDSMSSQIPKRPELLQRSSASSDVLNDITLLSAQNYVEQVTMQRQRSFPPQTPLEIHVPPTPTFMQLETPAPRPEILSSAVFQLPQKQAPFPRAARPKPAEIYTQQVGASTATDTTLKTTERPRLADTLSFSSGTFKDYKAAPSWRPQDWNRSKDSGCGSTDVSPLSPMEQGNSRSQKVSGGSNKELPQVPESAQLDTSPLSLNNPWNVSKPQVIQRPLGWV